MGRTILFSTLLAAGGALPWNAAAEADHAVSLSVVQVRGFQEANRVFYGSGVVVGRDRVATNCHVTRGALRVIVNKGGIGFPAASQQADTRRDLCLLAVPGIPFPTASLGSSARLSVGQPLYFYGYPRALGISFAQAQVQALHRYAGSRVIETSADFTFGGSGGGLFDDRGRLVGLATFLSAGQSRGYAIPADWIAALGSRKARRIEPLRGPAFWEDAAALPGFLRPPAR
jgi:S1-C subfamily serine protease